MKLTLTLAVISAVLFSPFSIAKSDQEKLQEINDMLAGNSEVIDSLHASLSAYLAQQNKFDQVLVDNHDYIYNNPDLPWFGAKKPKLTIAVLTDLSCPWCKKLDPVLHKIAEEYPNDVKVINLYVPLKEHTNSTNSATFALKVWRDEQDKFSDIEKMLMSKPGVHSLRSIMKVATANNVAEHVSTDKTSIEMVKKNYDLFVGLGIQGTPAMLIDGEIIPGYLPYEKLAPLVASKLAEQHAK